VVLLARAALALPYLNELEASFYDYANWKYRATITMNKQILRLAIPNIISNLSVPLLSTVDTALMGRQESAAYIGAVGLGAIIFNFIYWSFGFLRMGTTGLAAQAYGNTDHQELSNIMGRAFIVVAGGTVLIWALQMPIALASFGLLEGSPEVEALAREYYNIRIWAAPATIGLYAMMGWFFGMQNAIYPMLLTILINTVNIVANLILVYHFGMKADGVALGTVIAQYVGLFAAFGLFYYKYSYYIKYFNRKKILEIEAIKRFMSLNANIFIRTFCLIFVLAFFTNQSAKQGDVLLAVNMILMQLINWMAYGVDGFAYASESLVGKYAGGRDMRNVKKTVRYSFAWGMLLAVGFSVAYFFGGKPLLWLFTDQENIVAAALPFMAWMAVIPLIATPSYMWDGIYIGMTASREMRDSMLIAMLIFLVSYFAFRFMGNDGLWLALVVFLAARGLIQWLWWHRGIIND